MGTGPEGTYLLEHPTESPNVSHHSWKWQRPPGVLGMERGRENAFYSLFSLLWQATQQKQLKEGRLTLAQSFEGIVHCGGDTMVADCEIAGHIVSRVRRERQRWMLRFQLTSLFHSVHYCSPQKWCCLCLGQDFPPLLTQSRSLLMIHPENGLLGEVGNPY